MITEKIKNLFQFIDYLHSNIENFNQYNDLIKELELLDKEQQKVHHKKTFKDKLKYDEVQVEIETKFKTLQGNTASLIKDKAKELNVCSFNNEPNYSFNGIESEIQKLKENFINEDLPEIFKHKSQYLEYRTSTHKTFLSLQFFFNELDEITNSLFDFFKETENNEFEAFETKPIPVNNIGEFVKLAQQGHTKFTVPNSFLNPSNVQQTKAEPLPPQQTETETEQGTPTFTNNFDNIKPTEIYKHFKAGLVEKGYLTEQELNEYLKAAFELKTTPETRFKIKDAPNKATIEAVFYKYYKNVAGKIHGKQIQYAALLGDYFEGYKTTTVSSNFSKSVY